MFDPTNRPWLGSPARSFARMGPVGLDLETKIAKLIKLAWGPRENILNIDLIFKPPSIDPLGGFDNLIAIMLAHARKVAPGLNVPMMVPQVSVERLTDVAGQFVEQDGWVKIVVNEKFFLNIGAARAILCHELCHYVLSASGIKEVETEANERLTDVAIFVLGFGDVFLSGYKNKPGFGYRTGHQLGYLSDAEYKFVDEKVFEQRLSGRLQESTTEILERRFKSTILDAKVRKRLFDAARSKHPNRSKAELIQNLLDDYQHDRR